MKVILAGSSGFIGGEVLNQVLDQNSITSIIILSRRELPSVAARDSRIKIVVLHDFTRYSPSQVQELAGASACIWTLGGSNSKPTPAGKCHEVEVEYALTTANALLCAAMTNAETGEKIRFLFVSGIMSVQDQEKNLWFLEEGRKARGLAETQLASISREHEDFETVIIQTGKVLKKSFLLPGPLVSLGGAAIRVDELGAAMVELALHRSGSGVVGNAELRKIGKEVMRRGRQGYSEKVEL